MRPKLPNGLHYEVFNDATYVLANRGILFVLMKKERDPPKVFARFAHAVKLGTNYQEFDNEENAINGMLAKWRLKME